ncbi:fatty-acid--CoA ligase [Mycolicibacterium sp. 22603]|uniref:fatty-acid--CoA ligase n=1 Tax=Mycolicibacterium sp. 22603 TaxID=3453950 RepID=UPI003F873118
MRDWLANSLVLVSDYRVADPSAVWMLIQQRTAALADVGVHHVLVYTSTTDSDRVLVVLGIHAHGPVRDLLRSRAFFDWFDAVGVQDLPAVFAGELLERIDFDTDTHAAPPVMVCLVTSVADIDRLNSRVRDDAAAFRAAGVQRFWSFRALDDPHEVLMLQQIDDESAARRWLNESDDADVWLAEAGVGAYPPVFIGRFLQMMTIEPTGDGAPRS